MAERLLRGFVAPALLRKLSRREMVALLTAQRHQPDTTYAHAAHAKSLNTTAASLEDAEQALAMAKAEALAMSSLRQREPTHSEKMVEDVQNRDFFHERVRPDQVTDEELRRIFEEPVSRDLQKSLSLRPGCNTACLAGKPTLVRT